MFYSGWKFPTPQNVVISRGKLETTCFVQDTSSPGICLVHFLLPDGRHDLFAPGGNSVAAALQRESGGRVHLKSDVPIHPHSGVFYFEVEVRSIAAAATGNEQTAGVWPVEPEIVVGVCRKSLAPHSLPGEEAGSIGLFTAQRMVYMDGKEDGEAVRLHNVSPRRNSRRGSPGVAQEASRSTGVKVGDTFGCIVNLMDGTVRFTFNGTLLSVVGALSRRMPKHGYYPAVGMFRLIPGVSLRVVFPPFGVSASIPRCPPTPSSSHKVAVEGEGLQDDRTAAAGYFVFDFDEYSEGLAEQLVRTHQKTTLGAMVSGNGADDTRQSCDKNIIAAICKHLAARGMTKTLSAFEREQEELHYNYSFYKKEEKAEEKTDVAESVSISKSTNKDKGSSESFVAKNHNGQVEGKASNISYSSHIQKLRENISRGDIMGSIQCILSTGVISPVTRDKVTAVVDGADTLTPDFWGLVFFAQRQDILFLLRATHVVEVALATVERGLNELLLHIKESAEKIAFEKTPNTKNATSTVEFMEFAVKSFLEPFGEMSMVVKRHQRFFSMGVRTAEEAAFGMPDGLLSTEESRWNCDDLAALLFLSGDKELWSGPNVPITLLVRRSVPNIPPPRSKNQRRIVQMLSMLVSHQRAVCARLREHAWSNISTDWLKNWLGIIGEARAQYRARCWCILLHSIEDFNGALEYRLFVWLRGRERKLREAVKGGKVSKNSVNTYPREICDRWLFPSLRSAWRHVHAVAALEPLFNVVTKAFSDKLYRATTEAQLSTIPKVNKTSLGSKRLPKRGFSFCSDNTDLGRDREVGPRYDRSDSTRKGVEASSGSVQSNVVMRDKVSLYQDDVRLSFMYMKEIYKAIYA